MAEDVYGFITALGLERPALYGHSDGGIIGLLLAAAHPEALGVMAVSGTNLSPAGLIPSFVAEYTALNEAHPDPLVTLMLTEPQIDPEDLKKIRIPVLVTAGEHDLILRCETEKIAAGLPDSTLIILENEDHGSYIAGSEIMGQILIRFLEAKGYR
jgi:pimeloyl-ACP methyl ester carboxylesterase